MTVVCYDGKVLAADRKSIHRTTTDEGEVVKVSLKRKKIRAGFGGVTFNGEQIYAIGRSGKVWVTEFLINLIATCGRDIAGMEDWVGEQLTNYVKDCERPCNLVSSALLIMTSNGVHRLKVRQKFAITMESFPVTKKLAIGSGTRVAEEAMNKYHYDARTAVAHAQMHVSSCGGGIYAISRTRARNGQAINHRRFDNDLKLEQYVLQGAMRVAAKRLTAIQRELQSDV